MFTLLTRQQAIKLRKLDNKTDNYRAQQITLLEVWATNDGWSYYDKVAIQILKDLAPYGFVRNAGVPHEYPECVRHSYGVMFNALDERIVEVIGGHYELQGWDDNRAEIIWCEDYFDEQEAKDAYQEVLADGDKYVCLIKVDKEGMPIEDIACNF